MLIIPATPNVCPVAQGNGFLLMAILFRIQTRYVANPIEERIHKTRDAEHALYYYTELNKFEKQFKDAINANRLTEEQEARIAIQEAEWKRHIFLGELSNIILITSCVFGMCDAIRAYFQAQNEPPHPTTTREASPVGRVAQQAPGPDRRRSPRLHRQLRVSRVSQGDSQPMG